MKKTVLISTTEAAELLGISRVAVFRQIQIGKIKAEKIGRNYVIEKESLGGIYRNMTPSQEEKINKAVTLVAHDFREALVKLGGE